MKKSYGIPFFCLLLLTSLGNAKDSMSNNHIKEYKFTNRLIHESSPYLQQHAHNPVYWFPWGKEALEKAQKENKLIIVSIGYAACHWCHVMEHETFEAEDVAKVMNDNFVAIKVDREERPDIDQVYMDAVQLLTGRGGWPLNCVALPDGRPFYGGTYFSKDQWIEMLTQVTNFVVQNPDKAEQQAAAVTLEMKTNEVFYEGAETAVYTKDDLNAIFTAWKGNIDSVSGGHRGAPKFPLPVGHQFLLHYNYLYHNEDALNAVTITLDKMADGGIYDQIGGGFARYSTDAHWKVPHFEKMLYDNAQLVSLYSAAYQHTKNQTYKRIVQETLDFIKREMTSEEGGFYSSLDADSEGEEGKFYVWKKEELYKILGDKADLIIAYYNVTEKGNWEHGKNIFYKSANDKLLVKKYNITEAELAKRVSEAKQILLKERARRIRPGLDDKILTSWNALMLKAFVDAYRAFGNQNYLDAAQKNAKFINTEIKSADYRLHRNFKKGNATVNAFLDDYAFTVEAFISLYQATFHEKWLNSAKQLADYLIAHFYDKKTGMFFYTSDIDPALIARKIDYTDNVIPSGNSQMAKNLFVLGRYFHNDDYIRKSKKMLNNVTEYALRGGAYYANWDILMAWFTGEMFDISIVGSNFKAVQDEFNKYYLPNVLFSGGENNTTLSLLDNKLVEGRTMIYVCRNKVCKQPATTVKEALKQIIK